MDSTDEIGRVARAFDQVHAEAVRLAGNEAHAARQPQRDVHQPVPAQRAADRPADPDDRRTSSRTKTTPTGCPACSPWTTWSPGCAATRRTCWCSPARSRCASGASRCRSRTWPGPRRRRSSSTAGSCSTSSRGSWSPGRPRPTSCTCSRRSSRTPPCSPPGTPRCSSLARKCPAAGCCSRSGTPGSASPPTRLAEMNWRLDNPPRRRRVGVQAHGAVRGVPAGGAARGASQAAGGGTAGRVRPGLAARQPHRPGVAPVHRPAVAAAREGVVHRAGASAAARLAGRAGADLRPLAPAMGEPDMDGELPDGAMQTAAAAGGRSDWFRAKRPSGSAEQLPPPPPPPPPPVPAQDRDYAGYLASGTPVQAYDTPLEPFDTPLESFDTSGAQGWTLPAGDSWDDGGWRVAETMPPPSTGGQTTAGLPTRVPGANMFRPARRRLGAPSRRPRRPGRLNSSRPRGRAPRRRGRQNARAGASADSSSAAAMPRPARSARKRSAQEEGASP